MTRRQLLLTPGPAFAVALLGGLLARPLWENALLAGVTLGLTAMALIRAAKPSPPSPAPQSPPSFPRAGDDFEAMLLQENLTSLGRLAGGVAHELGNPLNTISSIAQLLRRRRKDDAFVREQAATIEAHVARLSRLSRILVDLAFPKKPKMAVFDVRKTLEETLRVARLDQRLKNAEARVDTPSELLRVEADEGAVHLILLNLLFNAADAVADKEGHITIAARRGDLGVEVRVIDNGPGIPKENRSRIFAPFFTTKEPGKGTGVGLTISCRLARAVGGELNLESSGPEGSCFLLCLSTPESDDEPPHPHH
ncbi:MAG: HAMP domain-containing sensor histidine kinase [Planctomycetota bacterium]